MFSSPLSKIYAPLILVSSVLPLAALAQDKAQVDAILTNVTNAMNTIVTLLFIVEAAVFIWGVIQFITKGDDPAAQTKAKSMMLWSVVGMTVTVAAWGIARLIIRYFGVGGQTTPTAPGGIT